MKKFAIYFFVLGKMFASRDDYFVPVIGDTLIFDGDAYVVTRRICFYETSEYIENIRRIDIHMRKEQ